MRAVIEDLFKQNSNSIKQFMSVLNLILDDSEKSIPKKIEDIEVEFSQIIVTRL